MTITNSSNISTPQPSPDLPPTLPELIDKWKAEGITLELIIAMIMSNPEGLGAMDVVSNNISGITKQSNILSKVQSDIITLNSILSKIESQLGGVQTMDQKTWDAFSKTLLTKFQQTYKDLFDKGGDLDQLETYTTEFPNLTQAITGIQAWEQDFTTQKLADGTTLADDLENWDGKSFPTDPNDQNASAFIKDIFYIAGQHYAANHPNQDGSKSDATDYLQSWWTDGNAGQQLVSGQSQQDTTEVQSYMQLLQGFDSSAQQDIQLASTQKSQIIQNEKTS
jgi:hypothetical protein